MGGFGIEEAVVEAWFIAEEEEAFGIEVESAEGVGVRGEGEFGEGSLAGLVRGELAEDAEGFVEGDDHCRGDSM